MTDERDFRTSEIELISAVKKTLMIIAKVIKDRNPAEVIKDIDPNSVIENKLIAETIIKTNFLQKLKDFAPGSEGENNGLEILVDQLTGEIKKADAKQKFTEKEIRENINKLARAIRKKITPDIPGLNPKEEGSIVGQLGPSIFAELIRKDES